MALDYPAALERLLGMLGEAVDVAVRGAGGAEPIVVGFEGELRSGGEVYGGELVGYHRDVLAIYVGDVGITLHPDRFLGAEWTEDQRLRQLTIQFGSVQITFRTGRASSAV
jgi:hypothetical protein